MPSASEIADRAMQLAEGFIGTSREELAEMAREDPQLLYETSVLLQERAKTGQQTAHSSEHLAFSLVHAAYELLRQQMTDKKP